MGFNLLALDGGGIRGYMTARILGRLGQDAGVNFNAANQVHGYSGTSTGGLLAIGLANNHSPGALADLYKDNAKVIFELNQSRGVEIALRLAARLVPGLVRLIDEYGIFKSNYVSSGLQRVGEQLVGDVTFGDFDENRVLAVNTAALKIPGSTEGWTSTTMCNHVLSHATLPDSTAIKQLDGALATAAAPSYFPPHEVFVDGKSLGYFADGGVFANNPAMNGITVAMSKGLAKMQDFSVISIGTGIDDTGIPASKIQDSPNLGILDWLGLQDGVPIGALLNITMTTSADNVTWITENLLNADPENPGMLRLNPKLPQPVALDATDPEDFQIMDRAVEAMFNDPEIWPRAVEFAKRWAA